MPKSSSVNLDLLGLFQSPPNFRLGQAVPPVPRAEVPSAACLRYPLRSHLHRIFLICLMVCLAIFTPDQTSVPAPFLWLGAIIAVAALYWRGLSLNYGPDALELCWRLHKLARICWSQLFLIELSGRGLLMLREREQGFLTVDPDLEEFDALCAVILRRAPAQVLISAAATRLLLAQARLSEEELVTLYGPHFLAEPAIHSHLWDPTVDPYESWQAVSTTLGLRLLKARGKLAPFVMSWGSLGRAGVTTGREVPKDCLAWARTAQQGGFLTVEVDYQQNGVRVYQCPVSGVN